MTPQTRRLFLLVVAAALLGISVGARVFAAIS